MSTKKRTVRTRLLMAGVLVGAVAALGLSWVITQNSTAQVSPEQEARSAALHAPPGSCLAWEKPDAANARIVPCAQPHLFEVTSVANLAAQYPPESPAPNLDQWRKLAEQRCLADAESYLGKQLDPNGKFSLNLLRPSQEEWNEGKREVRCGVQRAGPGGGLQHTTGKAATHDQSNVWEPGTCLGLDGKDVGDPVDCAKPHAYEIIATIDLATHFKFTDGYPSKEDQKAWLDKQCNAKLAEYAGSEMPEHKLGWDLLEKESWQAGSTKVNCQVGKTLEDGSGLAPLTGSISKDKKAASTSQAKPSTAGKPAEPSEGG